MRQRSTHSCCSSRQPQKVSLPLLSFVLLGAVSCHSVSAFSVPISPFYHRLDGLLSNMRSPRLLSGPSLHATVDPSKDLPQIFSSGYSTKTDLLEALHDAVSMACDALPSDCANVDLCVLSISSLYDGGTLQPATCTVPAVLAAAQDCHVALQHIIGCSAAGIIASQQSTSTISQSRQACRPIELESIPAVGVTLAVLPNCTLHTFHVNKQDLPDTGSKTPAIEWKKSVGLSSVQENQKALFWLLPSPAFTAQLDEFIQGMQNYFPESQIMGGIASTVSSLSRAKLYCYSTGQQDVFFSDGCVGVAITGDIRIQSMTAQGAKPVGGIYRVLKGQDSTIQIIVLDEIATKAVKEEEEINDPNFKEEEDDKQEEIVPVDAKTAMAQLYAKAEIPKPPLAEANLLMRTLSDDDQAFMRRKLLIGLEHGGNVGRTASELARLASGQGHRFTVHQVASAGMKDGSVTLPWGSVNVTPGTRLRFFVREPDFARREVEALWTGYTKRQLNKQFDRSDTSDETTSTPAFKPACCIIIPTLDRGNKFFQGKVGYESSTAIRMTPGVPCVSGFYANGIIGKIDSKEDAKTGIQGSASGYYLIGSRSGRPVFLLATAAAMEMAALDEAEAIKEAEAREKAENDIKRNARTKSVTINEERAPRSENGELILKRREVHSGRSLTVSTVEWSVAEKEAKPSSALEGFMWDKETEVDRFRERVPLSNLVSQCRISATDPNAPKPRDWVSPVKHEAIAKGFAIIPECKRSDPASGSLRRRYDLEKLVRDFTAAGVPAFSVNCDAIFFGGTIDHVTDARTVSSQAALENMSSDDGVIVPPILASDLLLYPYQLYRLLLAGADAVTLVCGALASKDLLYMTKIAASLQLQVLALVTSEVQLQQLTSLPAHSISGVIVSNRELEDYTFDEKGDQALCLLRSDGLSKLREVHGQDFLVLAEGRIGIIERCNDNGDLSCRHYLHELKAAGATGAIVGGVLAASSLSSDPIETLQQLQRAAL